MGHETERLLAHTSDAGVGFGTIASASTSYRDGSTSPSLSTESAEEVEAQSPNKQPFKEDTIEKQVVVFSICGACSVMFVATVFFYSYTSKFQWSGVLYGFGLYAQKSIIAAFIYCLCPLISLWLGLAPIDIELMQRPRSEWNRDTVSSLVETYGMRKIKIVDCINRRTGHVLLTMLNYGIFIPLAVPSQTARVMAGMVSSFLNVLCHACLINGDGHYARILFRGTRVRDGRLARVNVVVVCFINMGFFPLVTMLILHSKIAGVHAGVITGYCWMPNTWGDALAEIVGSFFGRAEFTVRGLGEINTKTLEGVTACWIASVIACSCYASLPGFPSEAYLSVPPVVLHMLVASFSTLMETICYRGTDNGFMVLSAALVVIWCYVPEAS